jgi:hypothetical protein
MGNWTEGRSGLALAIFSIWACAAHAQPQEVKLSPAAIDQYVGAYGDAHYVFKIEPDGDHLFGIATGESPSPLYATADGGFTDRIRDGHITFDMGADGKATALVLHAPSGDSLTLPRLGAVSH